MGLLMMAPLAWASPCLQDAEGGAGAWSMSGLWHIADASSNTCVGAHSGSHAFYFGLDSQCNYDDGRIKDASLVSPAVTLSSLADANLSFWTRWQVESLDPVCDDKLIVEKSSDGTHWSSLADLGPATDPAGGAPGLGMASTSGLGGEPLWQFVSINLSAYVGLSYSYRFRFVSGASVLGGSYSVCSAPNDAQDNFLGWVLDDISVGCAPGPLSLAQSANPSFASPADTVTYSFSAHNWDTASQSLQVWDTLPAGADFISASPPGTLSSGVEIWSLPSVAAGSSQSVTLVLAVDAGASVPSQWLNTASGSSSAGPPVFQSAQSLVKLEPAGLSLQKSASASTLVAGDQVTYSISLSNYTHSAYPEVDLVEAEPAGFTELSEIPPYDSGSPHTWKALSLQPGETRAYTLLGTVSVPAGGGALVNRVDAEVSGTVNASAQASLAVRQPPLPNLLLHAVYPQPAPSFKAGLPQSVFIYFETTQAMGLTLDLYTVSGELVRSIAVQAPRGKSQVEWNLKNNWGADVASGIYLARLWGKQAQGNLEITARIVVRR